MQQTIHPSTRPSTKADAVFMQALRASLLDRYSTLIFEIKGGCRDDGQTTKLYVQGVQVARASGFGYDKAGSCLAQIIRNLLKPELKALIESCTQAENTRLCGLGEMDYVLPSTHGIDGDRLPTHVIYPCEDGFDIHPMCGWDVASTVLEHITKHKFSKIDHSLHGPTDRRDILVLAPWPHYPIPHYMIAEAMKSMLVTGD